MVKTATGQNGDQPKWLQVLSKRINLLSSTMDLSSELLTRDVKLEFFSKIKTRFQKIETQILSVQ